MFDNSSLRALNVSIVHRRIKHHAKHSGYSSVYEFMDLPHANKGFLSAIAMKLPGSIKWRLHTLRPQQVGNEGLEPELRALSTTASSKPGICHFIYGEDTYFYTSLWQHKNKKIIASFHYPPIRLDERVNRTLLNRLDAVVLMSESQRSWFEAYMPKDRVHVIHHQVDTGFFKPNETPPGLAEQQSKLKIICVGGILRDMKMLFEVVKLLNDKLGSSTVQFDFLMPKQERPAFSVFDNVTIHAGITDEELRALYQGASIGFMPLIDCTANNAVLEMMACGLPVVCSNVGGIADYINAEGGILFDRNLSVEQIGKLIIELQDNPQQREVMGRYNRQRAVEHFSLPATATKLANLYKSLAE